jgi:hypothetical protein
VRTRETPADGFDTRSAREKTHTESHTRVSNVPSPLTKKPPERFRCASTGEEVCARVVDTTRVSCAVDEVATVDGTRARSHDAVSDAHAASRRLASTNETRIRTPVDPTRLLSRFFFSVVTPRLEKERDFVTVGAFFSESFSEAASVSRAV